MLSLSRILPWLSRMSFLMLLSLELASSDTSPSSVMHLKISSSRSAIIAISSTIEDKPQPWEVISLSSSMYLFICLPDLRTRPTSNNSGGDSTEPIFAFLTAVLISVRRPKGGCPFLTKYSTPSQVFISSAFISSISVEGKSLRAWSSPSVDTVCSLSMLSILSNSRMRKTRRSIIFVFLPFKFFILL